MATTGSPSGRVVSSPRPKGRDAKNTLCRNVVIYGHCRYENSGCNFQHDRTKVNQAGSLQSEKKRFNVDSPAFQPVQPSTPLQNATNLQPQANGVSNASRNATISPKAANAAIFTPKSQNVPPTTPSATAKELAPDFFPSQTTQDYQDFSHAYDGQFQSDPSGIGSLGYDTFNGGSTLNALAGATTQMSLNPYASESSQMGANGYYSSTTYNAPQMLHMNQHLYFPMHQSRQKLNGYQKLAHDFFIPETLRQDLQTKMDASWQVIDPTLVVNEYHSFAPLITSGHVKSPSLFGYKSSVFKAQSKNDGLAYALRRLEGFVVNDAQSLKTFEPWKALNNPAVVRYHQVFTTRLFKDGISSLVVVTDYYPLAKSLSEHHPVNNRGFRPVSEGVLWGYIVQIASALKDIHAMKLAARCINPSKVLLTSNNRIRLNGCAILDITQYDPLVNIYELQQQDIRQFGALILSIATGISMLQPAAVHSAIAQLNRGQANYSEKLRLCIIRLVAPDTPYSINDFLSSIAGEITATMNSSLHAEDTLTSTLSQELENGRLVRLMVKLGMINERGDYDNTPEWSETGPRYPLKLFRDYVFHRVDANGQPVLDLGHVITSLNKLDAGIDEKIALTSRDDQHIIVTSYKEVARSIESAFVELQAKPNVRSYRG